MPLDAETACQNLHRRLIARLNDAQILMHAKRIKMDWDCRRFPIDCGTQGNPTTEVGRDGARIHLSFEKPDSRNTVADVNDEKPPH